MDATPQERLGLKPLGVVARDHHQLHRQPAITRLSCISSEPPRRYLAYHVVELGVSAVQLQRFRRPQTRCRLKTTRLLAILDVKNYIAQSPAITNVASGLTENQKEPASGFILAQSATSPYRNPVRTLSAVIPRHRIR